MNLTFLNNFCFRNNVPGNTHIRCVPVEYIEAFPEFILDGHNFTDDIELKAGKQWIYLPCVVESIGFDEKETQTKHGPLTTPTISAFIPDDTPNIAQVTNYMKSKEWIVLLHYKTGEVKVLGDMFAPARFSSSFSNGNDNKMKGYSISFYSNSKEKTFFIQSEGSPDPGPVDCPAVPYSVTLDGDEVASGNQPAGVPLNISLDSVCEPCPTPSGIAYFEPNAGAYPLPSFADFDDGWRIANGVFANTPPLYPLYYQQLDWSSADPFNTLLHPNKYGSYARYTRIGGSTSPYNGVEPLFDVEDHFIGRCLRRGSTIYMTWANNLASQAANGFYVGSQNEYWYLKNMSNTSIVIMGIVFHAATHNGWTGTTDQSNTTYAIRLANSYPTASQFKTGTNRQPFLLKLIEP